MAVSEKETTLLQDKAIRESANRFALNTYNLRPLEGETPLVHHHRVVCDLASAILEMGKNPEDRTNPIAISLKSFQALADRSLKLRNEAVIDQKENRATEAILSDLQSLSPLFSLTIDFPPQEIPEKIIWEKLLPLWEQAGRQTSEAILWMSPPTSERGKKGAHEARFCLYIKGFINGELEIFIISVCGKQSPDRCLDIASQLVWRFGDDPTAISENEEQLREGPLFLHLPTGQAWALLGGIFQEEKTFENVSNGQCFKNKLEAFELAEKIYWKIRRLLISARNKDDFFWAGVQTEREMYATGRIFSLSSCGGSYLDILNNNPWYTNLFGNSFWGINALEISQSFSSSLGGESKKFVHNCGDCGTPINDYIGKGYKCKNCGGVYEGC